MTKRKIALVRKPELLAAIKDAKDFQHDTEALEWALVVTLELLAAGPDVVVSTKPKLAEAMRLRTVQLVAHNLQLSLDHFATKGEYVVAADGVTGTLKVSRLSEDNETRETLAIMPPEAARSTN